MHRRIVFTSSVVLLAASCATQRAQETSSAEPVAPADPPVQTDSRTAAAPAQDNNERDVVLHLDEGVFTYDQQGRRVAVMRAKYEILAEAAIERWGTISASWAPWHEARPEIRATVKLPDGRTFELDPKTIDEAPVHDDQPDVYSDSRVLRAPLPGLAVGAIVEQELVFRDTQPFFETGGLDRFYFGTNVPIHKARLVLVSPAALGLRWKARGIQLEPKETVDNGMRTLTFEAGPIAPQDRGETFAPPEVVSFPHVAFTTSPSWAVLAQKYSEIVDRQLGGAKLDLLAAGGKSREDSIAAILAKLHEKVRYTGIEFGEAAVIPRTPAEVFSRGYGDCKDKAAVLVAALRARGIDASLALLRAGVGEDVSEELPGMQGFNHAIVYVPGKPALWIDATIPTARPDYIPLAVQGRLARGNTAAARRWLDWARGEYEVPGGDDPLRGAPFAHLWTAGEESTAEKMRVVAATQMVQSPRWAERGVAVLEKARAGGAASVGLEESKMVFLDYALAQGYALLDKHAEAIARAEAVVAKHPKSLAAFMALTTRLEAAQRIAEARKLCEQRLQLVPDDIDALHRLAIIYSDFVGDFARANEVMSKIIDLGKPTATTYNNMAWNTLFLSGQRAKGLDWALRAVNMTKYTSAYSMHTLATLYAEEGKTAEAFQAFRTLMNLQGGDPGDADWYVLGRIAEEYDLRDIAVDAYKKVPKPEKLVRKNDPWVLAEKRIALLSKR